MGVKLFPLNRSRRLAGDVVGDTVDAAHLVDDAVAGAGQQVIRQARPIGGHEIVRRDRAQGNDLLVGAVIAHHAHTFDRQQYGKRLCRAIPQHPDFIQFLGENRVGLAQCFQAFPGEVAQAADG